MPQVVFVEDGDESLTVEAPEGGSLGDLCDDVGAPVPFSCRSATCGTCRIVVLEGAELLLPAEEDEPALLAIFRTPSSTPSQRLACQAKMSARPGRIVGRPGADDEP